MLRSFLQTAFRNLWRRKIFSAINIVGLATALTVSFLIYTHISYELSYDTYHTRGDNIYRVVTTIKTSNELLNLGAPYAMGPSLQREFPDVKSMARIDPAGSLLVRAGDKKFQEDNILYADSTIFSIFSFPLIAGNPKYALKEPFSAVLSETAAQKYFGRSNPLGKTITFGYFDATVTGIMKDIPHNSQFRTDIFVSMKTISEKWTPNLNEQWGGGGDTYVLLPEGYSVEQLKLRLPSFMQKYAGRIMKETNSQFIADIEPLESTYLHSKYGNLQKGNISEIYIFSTISLFILLIACINFINLSLARSSERAKEIGIRKISGSSQRHLIYQFLCESVLSSLIAFVFALILCGALTPLLRDISGKLNDYTFLNDPGKILSLLGLSLLIGLIAGIYPSIVLSSLKPVNVLKGQFNSGRTGILLRQVLVVIQFSSSIILIIGTIVVTRQLRFMRSQPLGFQSSQALIVDFNRDKEVQRQLGVIKQQLSAISNVESVCASFNVPGIGNPKGLIGIQSKNGGMSTLSIDLYLVDYDFIDDYKMEVIAGRSFSENFPADSLKAAVVNEATVEKLGYNSPDEIIGKRFSDRKEGYVIGVIKNFHYRSLRKQIDPMVFTFSSDDLRYLTIRLSGNNVSSSIAAITEKWKHLAPHRPIEYFFLDESFNKQYISEQRFGRLFTYFSWFALFISCLGLLGLALFSTIQRTKEIGIRKVLGSTVPEIVLLLTTQFLKWVLLAFVISAPIGALMMHHWLKDFAFRINIEWTVLATAGIIVFSIATITVCSQVLKYALAKPSSTLRTN